MKASVLAICVLFISSTAFAGYTYTTSYVEDTDTVNSGTGFYSIVPNENPAGTTDPISWTHDIDVPTGYYSVDVSEATLSICYWNATAAVTVDGDPLGTLPGGNNQAWNTETLDLLSPSDFSVAIMDGQISVTATPATSQLLGINYSTLWVKFECVTETWEEDPPVTDPVPAPGALVLGSLGTGLVGWLRRKIA